MAYLIPENARTSTSIPSHHRRVASALLSGFEDEVTAWYEPPFDPDGTRPHFIVVDPSSGVVLISVAEMARGDKLLGAWDGKLRVERDGEEIVAENPLTTATDQAQTLRTLLSDDSMLSLVPVASVAAFPYVTRAAVEELGLSTDLRLRSCIFRDDLDRVISESNLAVLPSSFARVLNGGVDDDLSPEAVDRLRGVIHPDVMITPAHAGSADHEGGGGSLFSAASIGEEDVTKVMDRQQERLAKGLGTGHRVIRGVAGSGKTLILVHRARMLAKLMPSKRILVTCFTRSLASQLRDQLSEYPNIEVVHLHSLMSKATKDAGLGTAGRDIQWDDLPRKALEAIQLLSGEGYRAVMVDEAQDFDTTSLQFCVELLAAADAEDQDLVIVADSAQNIYRRDFRWRDAGISAQGRTRILRVNYRNTKEILRFAHDFLVDDPGIKIGDATNLDDELVIIPAESAARRGPEPTVKITSNVDAEIMAVVSQVQSWYRPNLAPRSIAVLLATQTQGNRGNRITAALQAAGIPTFWVTDDENRSNRDEAGSAEEPVIVSTIHSAKGLEYPKVIVSGFRSAMTASPSELIADRKTLYVGFTRAIDELAVITTADSAFAGSLTNRSGSSQR